MEKYGTARLATDDNVRRMRFTCWITKATKTQSAYEYLLLFPGQYWLREHVSMLRYTYSTFPVLLRTIFGFISVLPPGSTAYPPVTR